MRKKFAVAIINEENETILGVFNTKEEADVYGMNNKIPHAAGLQYCFCAPFSNGMPIGNTRSIYNYYNV